MANDKLLEKLAETGNKKTQAGKNFAEKVNKNKPVQKEIEDPTADVGKRLFRIIIDEQFGPDAHEDVFVGVNGRHYLIKRGHEVVVPEGVVNVLKEAVTAKIVKHEDGTEEIKHIPRISFRVLGEVKQK